MKRYVINVALAYSTRLMIEWQLYGAALAMAATSVNHLELCGYLPNLVAFRTDSPAFVKTLAVDLSNYGLTVEEQP